MSDETERRIIDTRVQAQQADPLVDADLTIDISLLEGKYDVVYTHRLVGLNEHGEQVEERVPVFLFALTREEMVKSHVSHIKNWKPKTVLVTAGEQRTPLHPGVVRSIIEGKLGASELMLR